MNSLPFSTSIRLWTIAPVETRMDHQNHKASEGQCRSDPLGDEDNELFRSPARPHR